jgi:leucyl-tRNA synthetase
MAKGFLQLLNPICPFVTEEINERVFGDGILYSSNWPKFDSNKIQNDSYTLVVQINGKLRDKIEVSSSLSDDEIKKIALDSEKVKSYTDGLTIVKVVVVPKKLVSIVVK